MSASKLCYICNKPCKTQCSECKAVSYCSEACQRQHWNAHKLLCISKENTAKLAEKEYKQVINSPIFVQLCACVRKYNQELRELKYDRRVGGIVKVQSREQMPEVLREHGECSFSVRIGDLDIKDKDETGEGLWEFLLIPSRGTAKVKIQLLSVPELNEETYHQYRCNGVLDGSRPVVGFASGEAISAKEAIKEHSFPFPMQDSATRPKWLDEMEVIEEERVAEQKEKAESFNTLYMKHEKTILTLVEQHNEAAIEFLRSMYPNPTKSQEQLQEERRNAMKKLLPLLLKQ